MDILSFHNYKTAKIMDSIEQAVLIRILLYTSVFKDLMTVATTCITAPCRRVLQAQRKHSLALTDRPIGIVLHVVTLLCTHANYFELLTQKIVRGHAALQRPSVLYWIIFIVICSLMARKTGVLRVRKDDDLRKHAMSVVTSEVKQTSWKTAK